MLGELILRGFERGVAVVPVARRVGESFPARGEGGGLGREFVLGCVGSGASVVAVARSVSENFPTGGERAVVGGSHRLDHDVRGVLLLPVLTRLVLHDNDSLVGCGRNAGDLGEDPNEELDTHGCNEEV